MGEQEVIYSVPHIAVTITDESKDECFVLHYRDLAIPLHAGEMVDLSTKINSALVGWVAREALRSLAVLSGNPEAADALEIILANPEMFRNIITEIGDDAAP